MTDVLIASPLAHAIGLALVQFLWQGMILGGVCAALVITCRGTSAQVRYLIGCVTLVAMVAIAASTFAGYARQFSTVAPVAAGHPATVFAVESSSLAAATTPVARLPSLAAASDWIEARWPIVVLIWIAGVVLLSAQLLRGWLLVERVRRTAVPPTSADWPRRLRALAARLGVRRRLRLRESALIEAPGVIGWIRPIIVVPASAVAGLAPAQFEGILAHELAHVRRHDYLVNALQSVIEVLLFYHPAVWWVSRRIRLEREHCCDDLAVDLCGDRVAYADALTSLEERRGSGPALVLGARSGDLLARVRRVVDGRQTAGRPLSGWAAIAGVMTLACVALGSHGRAAVRAEGIQPPAVRTSSAAESSANVDGVAMSMRRPTTSSPHGRAVLARPTNVAGPVPAPQAASSLAGAAVDPQGGRLPGVTVIAMSVDGNIAGRAVTNALGRYAIADLRPGAYDVRVSLRGFKTFVNRMIQIGGGETRLNARLELGGVSETVTAMPATSSPMPPAGAASAAGPPPTDPRTSSDIFDRAKRAYDERQFAEAERMTSRALEVIRRQTNGGPIVVDPTDQGPVQIGGDIREPRKVRDVKPIYPPDAAAAGVEGVVIIDAVIG